jgi:hypothetical protein
MGSVRLLLLLLSCWPALSDNARPAWPVVPQPSCDRPLVQFVQPVATTLHNDTHPIAVEVLVIMPPDCVFDTQISGLLAVYDARWDRFLNRKLVPLGSPSVPPPQADLRMFALERGIRYQADMPIPQHGTAVRTLLWHGVRCMALIVLSR